MTIIMIIIINTITIILYVSNRCGSTTRVVRFKMIYLSAVAIDHRMSATRHFEKISSRQLAYHRATCRSQVDIRISYIILVDNDVHRGRFVERGRYTIIILLYPVVLKIVLTRDPFLWWSYLLLFQEDWYGKKRN